MKNKKVVAVVLIGVGMLFGYTVGYWDGQRSNQPEITEVGRALAMSQKNFRKLLTAISRDDRDGKAGPAAREFLHGWPIVASQGSTSQTPAGSTSSPKSELTSDRDEPTGPRLDDYNPAETDSPPDIEITDVGGNHVSH